MTLALLRKVAIPAVILAAAFRPAFAVDGIAVSAHYEQAALGNIHDAATPGKLIRYDIKDDKVVGSRALYEKEGVGGICISPFGNRVAFTKPGGMIAIVSMDGGPETDLVSYIGDEKPKPDEPVFTGLQWPASEGGQWLYYLDGRNGGSNNNLRRVNVETKQDELVVHFNRSASGGFALSMDATPHSGKFVKRTDNYVIAIYDLAQGDGDMYNCGRTFGCGESISPDGSLLTANGGWHNMVNLVDMAGQNQHDFRLSQWNGDPTANKHREQIEWAWQGFRWSVNSQDWLAVTQGKLKMGSTYETYFEDLMLYDWVNHRQINVTNNPVGQFDRADGFWETRPNESFLGYFSGKAPLTVDLKEPGAGGSVKWDFGDSSPASESPAVHHTYAKEGAYTLKGTRAGRTLVAQVTVQKRRRPTATCHYVNNQCLLVLFDEPVQAKDLQVKLASGVKVAAAELSETGKRMLVTLADPLKGSDRLQISGVQDFAQVPNVLDDHPVPVVAPSWPSSRQDLVFLWEDGKKMNAVYNDASRTVRELRVSRDAGTAGLDRYGRMRLEGGRMSTGFFSQANAQMDFGPLVQANAFTLEATIQPTNLKQRPAPGVQPSGLNNGLDADGNKVEFPVRIVNCSSWMDADWDFLLGQQDNRLMFSIRTTDNFLTTDGKKVAGDLQGRAPIYEIAKLPDTAAHHVAVTYVPGRLVAYLDGQKSFETADVTGALKAFGYGELCFGDNHNGGRHQWLGKIEGVAIYKRALEAGEVRKNYEAYTQKIRSRKIMPQLDVEATLIATSTIPTPKSIAPYRDALVINEYQVGKVINAAKDWNTADTVQPGQKILVAQWGLIDDIQTTLAAAKVGDTRHLVLEIYNNHPDKLDEINTSNSLDPGLDLTMLYEPRP